MKSSVFEGHYLFHLHTPLTDGRITIREYFEYASRNNVECLIFLEHIRQQPSYSVDDFIAQVRTIESEFRISAKIGFEAKLLQDGSLDISPEHLEQAEVIGIAEHGFPNDFGLLRTSLLSAIGYYRSLLNSKEIVWVHPGLWFKKNNPVLLDGREYIEMLLHAESQGVKIERNLRYNLAATGALENLNPSNVVIGADAHRMDDLKKWSEVTRRDIIANR